jgi:periplasmic protein TonB
MHKRDERTGFIISLSLHALLFFIGGVIFVKTARYNIQNVPQSTTVELVEAAPPVVEDMAPPKPKRKAEVRKIEIKKQVVVKIQKNLGRVINTKADPNYFQNPPPEYPELARQMRQEGLVMLAVDVDREGMPIKVEILKSSGFRLLDQAALKAVRHWKFQPGSVGGIPVESTVSVPIRFQLVKS